MLVVRALDVGDVIDVGDVDGFAQLLLETPGDAPHLAHHPSRRAQRFGQVLGAEDEEGHHEDHEHLGYPDVEHRALFGADRPADGSCPSHMPGRAREFWQAPHGGRAMATHEIRIDRSVPLTGEPGSGHNRWHPDIPPLVTCQPGDEVVMETRDAFDHQFTPDSTADDIRTVDLDVVHPLTGPVAVEGAQPGDLLVVEVLEVTPRPFAYTVQVPGFGFLRDEFPEPFFVRWEIADGAATSDDLPGVRVPGAPFMGVAGLAPSHDLLRQITAREQALLDREGFVLPPDASGAVPTDRAIAGEALRTIPPRETGGNTDIKHLSAGARIYFPVWTEGALFSAGDAHFAQGDCEVCGTAIEMDATLRVRFDLRAGVAAERGIRDLQFERDSYVVAPEIQAPRRFFATTGLSVDRDGVNHAEDVTVAARNALLNMIDHLGAEYGYSRQQAYAICSVAVDLKISEMVDVPNFIVSAFLPLDILT
jgi:formamidase